MMSQQRMICIAWGFCLLAIGIAHGAVYYVDVDNGGHDGVFDTPAGAATNIQSAVDLINTILWGNIRDEGTVVNYNYWTVSDPYPIRSMTNTITTPISRYPDSNNIEADPLFVNAAAGDYRLQRLSPAVDAGTNLAWMAGAVDLDGHSRIDGTTFKVDIGAYEYQYTGTTILVR